MLAWKTDVEGILLGQPLPRRGGAELESGLRLPRRFQKGACLMKAWIYQDDKQVKKHGTKKASWYVGWIDPEGKRRCQSCGPVADLSPGPSVMQQIP
jgi:hypothetical protein